LPYPVRPSLRPFVLRLVLAGRAKRRVPAARSGKMAVGAVSGEPVSRIRLGVSLFRREFTGKFVVNALHYGGGWVAGAQNSWAIAINFLGLGTGNVIQENRERSSSPDDRWDFEGVSILVNERGSPLQHSRDEIGDEFAGLLFVRAEYQEWRLAKIGAADLAKISPAFVEFGCRHLEVKGGDVAVAPFRESFELEDNVVQWFHTSNGGNRSNGTPRKQAAYLSLAE